MLHSVPNLFSEVWVWLALAAAVGYAAVGFIDEYLLSKTEDDEVQDGVGNLVLISGFFGIVISAVFGVYSMVIDGGQSLLIDTSLQWKAVIAGVLEVVWLIPYLYAVHRSGVMNVAPIFQAIPIFVMLIGGVFFGEVPTTFHVIGSFAIILGSFILNSGSLIEDAEGILIVKVVVTSFLVSTIFLGPMLYLLHAVVGTTAVTGIVSMIVLSMFVIFVKTKIFHMDIKTIALMFFACIVIAIVYFLFKGTVLEGNFVAATFWSGVGMTLFTVLVSVFWPTYRKQFIRFLERGNWEALSIQAFNEALNAFSVLSSHMANAKAPSVMLASTFNCFHPLFTLMIGGVAAVLGSKKHRDHLKGGVLKIVFAILIIAIGTVIVSL